MNRVFVNLLEGTTALGDGGSLFSSLYVKPGFSTVGWEGEERVGIVVLLFVLQVSFGK